MRKFRNFAIAGYSHRIGSSESMPDSSERPSCSYVSFPVDVENRKLTSSTLVKLCHFGESVPIRNILDQTKLSSLFGDHKSTETEHEVPKYRKISCPQSEQASGRSLGVEDPVSRNPLSTHRCRNRGRHNNTRVSQPRMNKGKSSYTELRTATMAMPGPTLTTVTRSNGNRNNRCCAESTYAAKVRARSLAHLLADAVKILIITLVHTSANRIISIRVRSKLRFASK